MSVRLRGCWRPNDKLSVLSEPLHAMGISNYYLDAETSTVYSVFIARGYLRSNAQNRHPFHHLPISRGEHGQDQNCISYRILAISLDQNWIWILIFEKKIGSGQEQDICLISVTKFS